MAAVTTNPAPGPLTVGAFARRRDSDHLEELAEGTVVPTAPPRPFREFDRPSLCGFRVAAARRFE